MKKRLNIPQKRKRAARNLLITVLALILTWVLLGMPSFTKEQAFDRALRENLLPKVRIEAVFGEDGTLAALGEKDGKIYQVGVHSRILFWDHTSSAAVTEPADGIFIVPLMAYGYMKDSPEIAVRAEGVSAELTMEMDGKIYSLIAGEKQGNWFVFRFDREIEKETGSRYENFVEGEQYTHIDRISSPKTTYNGSFHFVSYNADGSIVSQAKRDF